MYKKLTDAEKLEKLQNKYKILANKLRTHMQKDFVYRNNEAKKNQKLKDINTILINKIYELSNDDNLAEIDDFIKEVLKKGKTDEKV